MRRASFLLLFLLLGSLLAAAPVRAETQYYTLKFTGAQGEYVDVGTITLGNGSFSIVALIRLDGNTTDRHVIAEMRDTGYSVGGKGFSVHISRYNKILVGLGDGTNYITDGTVVSDKLEYHRYYLIVVVFDRSAGQIRAYVDCQQTGTADISPITGSIDSGEPLWLGASKNVLPGSRILNGTIAMFALYTVALSDSEIQAIYNDPLNPPTNGLVLEYLPSSVDTANNVWMDKSGNGNDGTIYGATPERVVLLTFNSYSVTGGAINATVTDLTEGFSAPAHLVFTRYSNEPHVFQVFADGFRSVRIVAVPNANKQFTAYLAPIIQASPEPPGEQIGELFVGNETDKGIIGDRTLAGFVALITIFGFLAIARVDGSTGAVIGTVLLITLSAGGYLPQSMLFIGLFLAGGLTYYVVINAIGIGRR